MARFNPPPNWPAPPQGWTPPPGWQPDPTWPPPPPGWQVWAKERRPAIRIVGRFALALLLIMISGSAYNAGVDRALSDVLTAGSLGAIGWAFAGFRRT